MKALFRHSPWLAFVPLLAIGACTQSQPAAVATGSLMLCFGQPNLGARTIVPSVDLDIASYDVQGSGPDGAAFSASAVTGASSQWDDLAAGSWEVTADGKNAEGVVVATGAATATIVAGETAQATITVAPPDGQGSIQVDVSWPAPLVSTPSVIASLATEDGTTFALTTTLTSDGGSCTTGQVGSGYYYLSVQLWNGDKLVWGRTEAVRILAGEVTRAAYPLAAQDVNGTPQGGLALTIQPDLMTPFTVTLSGIQPILPLHTDMTVSASSEAEPDAWRWFVDGQQVPGSGSPTLTVGSALSPGNYWLDVVAQRGSILSSGHGFFVVSDRPPVTAPGVGDVIVNEIMIDPAGVSDTNGEWFELCNVTSKPLDLQGLVIRTASQFVSIRSSTTAVVLEPGAYCVLCRNGDPAVNGGVTAGYVYGSGISLPNGGGSLTLAEYGTTGMDGTVIDAVQWTTATAGKSYSLRASARNATDNDAATSWYWCTRPYSATDQGTPGTVNDQ